MAAKRRTRGIQPSFASPTHLLPVIVGVLLMAIVAIFILKAPNQIITPSDTGYLNVDMPVPNAPVPTSTG